MFKNLTIRGLQLVAGTLSTISMVALVFFNYNQLSLTDDSINHQVVLTAAVMHIKDARIHVVQIQQFLTDVGATSDDGGYAEAQENLSHALASLEQVKKFKPQLNSDIETIKTQISQVHRVGVEMAQAYVAKGQAAGNAIMKRPGNGLDDASAALADKLDGLSSSLSQELQQATENSQNAVQKAGDMVLWLTLMVMAVLGLVTIIFYLQIIPPLLSLRDSMLDSEGLSEYGHIQALRSVEEPHAKLHQMIKDIIQSKKAGNSAKAESIYNQIEPLSKTIIKLLNQVEMEAQTVE